MAIQNQRVILRFVTLLFLFRVQLGFQIVTVNLFLILFYHFQHQQHKGIQNFMKDHQL
jgi:hypothetical protein